MKISGLRKTTLIDYLGKIACTIFLHGCNLRCGYCYNPELVLGQKEDNYSEEGILKFLEKRKNFLDGVCISGGEPTLQLGLESFVRKIKNIGFAVKLDTNGSTPWVLMKLKQENLIDYIAMDIKGPESLYPRIIGKDYIDFRDDVEKGMVLATQFPHYEFRTTIVPVRRDDNEFSFMTVKEVVDTAKWIVKRTGNNNHLYWLQPFVPKENGLINHKVEEFPETSKELLEEMKKEIIKYLPNCRLRNEY